MGDGKSGMLFFFTQDRRYVLKTVKANEMAVLVDQGSFLAPLTCLAELTGTDSNQTISSGLLPAYLKHMMSNPGEYLCCFSEGESEVGNSSVPRRGFHPYREGNSIRTD